MDNDLTPEQVVAPLFADLMRVVALLGDLDIAVVITATADDGPRGYVVTENLYTEILDLLTWQP